MNTDQSITHLLDELVAGKAGGKYLDENLDLILTWLANPDSESVSQFRKEYIKRNISVEILRGYVFFILQQKLFNKNELKPHEVLGLSRTATKDNVKARYRKLMRVFHPDKATQNIDDFNSIAEKINLAYRQLMKGNEKTAYVKVETSRATSAVYPAASVKNDKTESPLARKVRHKIGGVKQFQLLFFGGVASFCLFVVVLLYLQSGDPLAVQSYSYKAKTQSSGEVDVSYDSLKPDTTVSTLIDEIDEKIEKLKTSSMDASVDAKNTIETHSPILIQASADAVSENLNQTQLEKTQQVLPEETGFDHSQVDTVENKPELAKNLAPANLIDQQQYDQAAEVSVTENQPLVDLLSDGVDTSRPVTLPSVTGGSENNANQVTDAVQIKPSSSTLLGSERDTQLSSASNKSDLHTDTSRIQDHSDGPVENNQSASLEKPVSSSDEEQVFELSQLPVKNIPAELTREQQIVVPVEEVDVAALNKTRNNRFDVANIFEKRFARKFLVEYLESIEKGNLAKIKSYLSNTLIIDGVAKNKTNYLKNTYALISQTSKRQYHVQFVGDVLRLDSGVFRVTVSLNHTYVFKNNIISKESAIKKYDIKRYSNGSEIINISSA